MVRIVARLVTWTVEVFLRLSMVVLRPVLAILEELLWVVLRVAARLAAYPESWVVIAVAVLWLMAGHGLVATVVALTAVAGVTMRWLLREHGW